MIIIMINKNTVIIDVFINETFLFDKDILLTTLLHSKEYIVNSTVAGKEKDNG